MHISDEGSQRVDARMILVLASFGTLNVFGYIRAIKKFLMSVIDCRRKLMIRAKFANVGWGRGAVVLYTGVMVLDVT